MKNIILIFVMLASAGVAESQTQFTLKYLSDHVVGVYFRPITDMSPSSGGSTGISNFGFMFRLIHGSVNTLTTGSVITSTEVTSSYVGGNTFYKRTVLKGSDDYYYIRYLPNILYTGLSYTANKEYLLATVTFPSNLNLTTLQLVHLPNGTINTDGSTNTPGTGNTGNTWAAYMEYEGLDMTYYPALFYTSTSASSPVNGGGTYTAGSNTITGSGLSYLAINPTVLPITLIDFIALQIDRTADLSWITENAVNFSHFEVECQENGNWTKISSVDVNNGTVMGSHTTYSFVDAQSFTHAVNGNVLYRLKMVDKDGQYSYSPIRIINFGVVKTNISIFPNPAKDDAMASGVASSDNILIYSGEGKLLKTITASGNSVELPLHGYAAGLYIIQIVRGKEEVSSTKLIKVK